LSLLGLLGSLGYCANESLISSKFKVEGLKPKPLFSY
jgi:hypothetical protein